MLSSGRLDNVISFRKKGIQVLGALGIKGIRILEPAVASVEGFVWVHKKHQDLIDPLATGLKRMKADGRFRRIANQHLQKQHQQSSADPFWVALS